MSSTLTPAREDIEEAIAQKGPSTDATAIPPKRVTSSSWSMLLENWFSRGAGHKGSRSTFLSEYKNSPIHNTGGSDEPIFPMNESYSALQSEEDLTNILPGVSDGTANQEAKVKHYEDESELEEGAIVGPYQLLAKERLMGIYVAIFIYRGLKPLVKGTINLVGFAEVLTIFQVSIRQPLLVD